MFVFDIMPPYILRVAKIEMCRYLLPTISCYIKGNDEEKKNGPPFSIKKERREKKINYSVILKCDA